MKYITILSVGLFASCATVPTTVQSPDFNNDGTVSQQELSQFNNSQNTQANQQNSLAPIQNTTNQVNQSLNTVRTLQNILNAF